MLRDFVTLGWDEYATIGKHIGGWATDEALYCVEKGYDTKSETFKISYLAHEGRHFKDFNLFPDIDNTNLEYRAKLTELSLAKETLYDLIEFFIDNANSESINPHPVANYSLIKNLSRVLFNSDFENDISKWKKITSEKLNKTAEELNKSTRILSKNYKLKK